MLPAAASLQKQGANKGATTAFLISTPESGVDSIAVTYALLDPLMTVIRPIAAFFTAIAAGIIENIISWQGPHKTVAAPQPFPADNCGGGSDSSDPEHDIPHTVKEKIVTGVRYAVIDVWGDIALWFYVGVLIAAIITVMIPDALMVSVLGGGLASMLIMLVIGVPLYICATASTPVAAALILKGVSPGAALVFLLVGPATNITSLSVLISVLGRKSTVRYLVVLSVAAVFFGLAVDVLYRFLNISPQAVVGEAAELVPMVLKLISVFVLVGFSIKPLAGQFRRIFSRKKESTYVVASFPDLRSSITKSNTISSMSGSDKCGCDHPEGKG